MEQREWRSREGGLAGRMGRQASGNTAWAGEEQHHQGREQIRGIEQLTVGGAQHHFRGN